MAFTEVGWANGDTITELKLDQMVASEVHVREEANFAPLVTAVLYPLETMTGTIGATVSVDGIVGDQASLSGTGAKVESDIDISSLTDGLLHTIILNVQDGGWDVGGDSYFYFYKTVDMDYISVKYYGVGTAGKEQVSLTIIGHRQAKSWT